MNHAEAGNAAPLSTPGVADIILPVQFYQFAGRGGLSSEQRLMLAVLADAINILQTRRFSVTARRRQLYLETERWVFEGVAEHVFSFDYVCEALAINPQALRRRLTSMLREHFGAIVTRMIPTRLRLKESSRAQHLSVNRVRIRHHRSARRRRAS